MLSAKFWYTNIFYFKEKRLSDLSNQSHDSQVSNSTLSATSHEDRQNVTLASQKEDLVDGHSPQEEEDLDEMDVEYIEVITDSNIWYKYKTCCICYG